MTKAVMRSLVLIATLVLSAAGTVAAEDPVSSKVDEILAELRQLRILVQSLASVQGRLPPPERTATTNVNVGAAPFLGSQDAPLTIVEFTDFQCPFCNRFFVETFPALKKNYIDTGEDRNFKPGGRISSVT